MASTLNWVPGKLVKVLVFGKFKTFKTGGACTFPRPVVMDFDRGIAVVRHPRFVERFGLRDVQYESFMADTVQKGGIPVDHKMFDSACIYFDRWMTAKKRDQFDTWVIDSGTTLSRAALNKAVVLLGGGQISGMKSQTHDSAKKHGLMIPKIQDYGAERSMVTQFVAMVLESGKHVVFICHEKELMTSAGDTEAIVPLLTGKGASEVPLMFDEVWRTQAKKEGTKWKYIVRTEPHERAMVGSRSGVPDEIEWHWDAVNGALTAIKDKQHKQVQSAKEK